MPSLSAFLDRFGVFIDKAPIGYSYAVETRNNNYLREPFFKFLAEHRLGCVLLDGYYMPPPGEVSQSFNVNTSNFIVLRLHGSDRSGIEEKTKGIWNQIIEPQETRLASAKKIVHSSMDAGSDVYVNVNNHYEGCAPLTIQRFLV